MPATPRLCGAASIRSFFGPNAGGSAHSSRVAVAAASPAAASPDSQGLGGQSTPSLPRSTPSSQVSSAETVATVSVGERGSAESKDKGGVRELERVCLDLEGEELASFRGGARGAKGGRGGGGTGGKARERAREDSGGIGSTRRGSASGRKGPVHYVDDSQDEEEQETVVDVDTFGPHRAEAEASGGCQLGGGGSGNVQEVVVIEDSQDVEDAALPACQGDGSEAGQGVRASDGGGGAGQDGESGGGAVGGVKVEWECGACTLRNANSVARCDACGAAPPAAGGSAADSAAQAQASLSAAGLSGKGQGLAGSAAMGGQGGGVRGGGRGRQWLRRWGFRVSSNTERVYVYARKAIEGGEGEGAGGAGGLDVARDLETACFLGSVLYLDLLDGGAPEWLADQQHDGATGASGAADGSGDGVCVKRLGSAEERLEVEEAVRMFVKDWGHLRAVERAKLSDASARRLLRLPLASSLAALSRSSAATATGEQDCIERYVTELPFGEQAHLCGWCGAAGRNGSRFCSAKCSEAFGVCASSAAIRRQLYELEKGVCQLCRLDAVGPKSRSVAVGTAQRLVARATRYAVWWACMTQARAVCGFSAARARAVPRL
jgi:hypothetical protein